jgi:alpha-tubulin suppressor-like RCC1 family protein
MSDKLQNCIYNLQQGTPAEDIAMVAAQVSYTTSDRSIVVDTVEDLPSLLNNYVYNNIGAGNVYFVREYGIPVVSSEKRWVTLDGRVVRTDEIQGYIYQWGLTPNTNGVDSSFCSCPTLLISPFDDWCQVSLGTYARLAVRSNGTLWAWDRNNFGQLGDGTTTNRSSPVSVVGGFTDWCQVSAGATHGLGMRCNGTLWAWGSNSHGQLGDNTPSTRSSPVSVVGGFTDWCQASAGYCHNLAVRTNGTLWSWGYNGLDGRLGDNTLFTRSSPVSVVGGFTDWCQVSAGGSHNLAVRTNGTLWAWGRNVNGRLGDGTTTSRLSPVSVVGGFTDWCQASAGSAHSAAIRTNGTLWTWGRNFDGDLGDGTTVDKSSPVSVIGGFTDWCYVDTGSQFSMAIKTNGDVWGWGLNWGSIFGFGTSQLSPVSAACGFGAWNQISAQYRGVAGIHLTT